MMKITNEVMDAYVDLVRKHFNLAQFTKTPDYIVPYQTSTIIAFIERDMSIEEQMRFYERLKTDIPMNCPVKGSFVGYKKCLMKSSLKRNHIYECIVKLEIPEDAYRSSAFYNKCRCSKAKVLDIYNPETGRHLKEAVSYWDHSFVYKIGETVECDEWQINRFIECGGGIHFFMSEKEALKYNL